MGKWQNSKLPTRFWNKVIKSTNSDCWEWQASKNRLGYGNYWHDRKMWRAHRIAYAILVGPIPTDALITHNCDNPPCVNPFHLKLGTPASNMVEKVIRYRCNAPHGEQHWNNKLTATDVIEIRALRGKEFQKDIALRFGVNKATIGDVQRGKIWKHINAVD